MQNRSPYTGKNPQIEKPAPVENVPCPSDTIRERRSTWYRGCIPMPKSSIVSFLVKEVKEALPPMIFFAIGFNLIVLTTNLILRHYRLQFANHLLATTAALIVGKAVLVANALPFFHRFDNAPLIKPVLFKSSIYFLATAAARILERLIEFLIHGGTARGLPEYVTANFIWGRFLAVQIWIAVLFLIYTFITELNRLFGDGELSRILFTWHPTELKSARRRKIRTLTTLARLADAHTVDDLRNPATQAHAEMIALIGSLAKAPSPSRRT
ncbi:hypothetical protein HUK84_14055 [Nguyenibacter vanlangensis]|uniref:Uncharacterized protein n=1 Tax=Nguyenibacter vanlangensis TaxID=1216886 RepID=A0A7Y7IXP1_9PROT|nr:hypothetical protein [Nguyenibacter vanlangensis]